MLNADENIKNLNEAEFSELYQQNISVDFRDAFSIANLNQNDNFAFNKYMQEMVTRLRGPEYLQENPIVFVLSDSEQVNACFYHNQENAYDENGQVITTQQTDEYGFLKQTPVERSGVPCIMITKGMLELQVKDDVDNPNSGTHSLTESQLAFIIGHELNHHDWGKRRGGIEGKNSKQEEQMGDINSVEWCGNAGYNLQEISQISSSIFRDDDKYTDLSDKINAALDVHTTNDVRREFINVKIKEVQKDLDQRQMSSSYKERVSLDGAPDFEELKNIAKNAPHKDSIHEYLESNSFDNLKPHEQGLLICSFIEKNPGLFETDKGMHNMAAEARANIVGKTLQDYMKNINNRDISNDNLTQELESRTNPNVETYKKVTQILSSESYKKLHFKLQNSLNTVAHNILEPVNAPIPLSSEYPVEKDILKAADLCVKGEDIPNDEKKLLKKFIDDVSLQGSYRVYSNIHQRVSGLPESQFTGDDRDIGKIIHYDLYALTGVKSDYSMNKYDYNRETKSFDFDVDLDAKKSLPYYQYENNGNSTKIVRVFPNKESYDKEVANAQDDKGKKRQIALEHFDTKWKQYQNVIAGTSTPPIEELLKYKQLTGSRTASNISEKVRLICTSDNQELQHPLNSTDIKDERPEIYKELEEPYNSQKDNAVFQALEAKLKSGENPGENFVASKIYNTPEQRSIAAQVLLANALNPEIPAENKLNQDFRFGNSGIRPVSQEMLLDLEIENLYEKRGNSSGKNLFGSMPLQVMGLPEFSADSAAFYADRKKSNPQTTDENTINFADTATSLAVLSYLSTSKTNDFPMEYANDLLLNKSVVVSEGQDDKGKPIKSMKEKFEPVLGDKETYSTLLKPFLENPNNWPNDLVKTTEAMANLYSAGYYGVISDSKPLVDICINRIGAEKDKEKQLQSLGNIGKLINSASLSIEEQNDFKSRLVSLPSLWSDNVNNNIDTYNALASNDMFPTDLKFQNALIGTSEKESSILGQIAAVEDSLARKELCEKLVGAKNRIENHESRNNLLDMYSQAIVSNLQQKLGTNLSDDGSQAFYDTVMKELEFSKSKEPVEVNVNYEKKTVNQYVMNASDADKVCAFVAESVLAQKKLAFAIKPNFEQDNSTEANSQYNDQNAKMMELFNVYLKKYPEKSGEVLDFALSDGNLAQAKSLSENLTNAVNEDYQNFGILGSRGVRIVDDQKAAVERRLSPEKLQQFQQNFANASMEEKTFTIMALLNAKSQDKSQSLWQASFNETSDKILSEINDPETKQAGKNLLYSYLYSTEQGSRDAVLCSMLVAAKSNANNGGGDEIEATEGQKLGQGLKKFLENQGSAGIKLGQALASCDDVDYEIRGQLQDLKTNATKPKRWELFEYMDKYDNIKNDNGEKIGNKQISFGKTISAASFFVTMKINEKNLDTNENVEKIIKVAREGPDTTKRNFEVFNSMLEYMSKENVEAQKRGENKGIPEYIIDNYEKGSFDGATFKPIVAQALDSVNIETDMQIGYNQYKTAENIYPSEVRVGENAPINLDVMKWTSYGTGWAIMDFAKGVDFKELPKEQQSEYGQAYLTVELNNMLCGGKFDHDRHAGQIKINPETKTIGLFDTGAMAIKDPSDEEKAALGAVLGRVVASVAQSDGSNIDKLFVNEINNYCKDLNDPEKLTNLSAEQRSSVSNYLIETQRGMIALTDFIKAASKDGTDNSGLSNAIQGAMNNPNKPVDAKIIDAFNKEIVSFAEETKILSSAANESSLGRNVAQTLKESSMNKDPKFTDNEIFGKLAVDVLFIKEQGASMGEALSSAIEKTPEIVNRFPMLKAITTSKEASGGVADIVPPEAIESFKGALKDKQIDMGVKKGALKALVNKMDYRHLSSEERLKVGTMLCLAEEKRLENLRHDKKANISDCLKEVSIEAEKNGKTTASQYIKDMSTVLGVVKEEKAFRAAKVMCMLDKEVAKGYNKRLSKNPKFSKKILAKASDLVPRKAIKAIVKGAMKTSTFENIVERNIEKKNLDNHLRMDTLTQKLDAKATTQESAAVIVMKHSDSIQR